MLQRITLFTVILITAFSLEHFSQTLGEFQPSPALQQYGERVSLEVSNIQKLQPKPGTPESKIESSLLRIVSPEHRPDGFDAQGQIAVLSRLAETRQANLSTAALLPEGQVYVYISLNEGYTSNSITGEPVRITDLDDQHLLVSGWVAFKDILTLAENPAVRVIRPVFKPVKRTGSALSEGDSVHNAANARNNYGVDGSGIKVGIISDGVDNWTTAKNSGDLPSGLTVLSNVKGGDEGTAMLEIVHDLAPGADLYFHDHGNNWTQFNNAIDALAAAGCDIICDDIGWLTVPYFEDGVIASHIPTVTAGNVVYISSAGNDGYSHYQGGFSPLSGNSLVHDFSGTNSSTPYLYVSMKNGDDILAVFQWDDQYGFSSNDYNLYLVKSSSGQVIASSTDSQSGSGDPIEVLSHTITTGTSTAEDYQLEIRKSSSAVADKELEIFIYYASNYSNNIVNEDAIYGHPAAAEAMSVAAVRHSTPNTIEGFSSNGPSTIAYPTAEERDKPDITGVNGVSITGAGGFSNPFFGTSAAAPHIAGIAALIWSKDQTKTASQVSDIITNNAIDLGNRWYDNTYGHGRADAMNSFMMTFGPAINAPVATSATNITTNSFTATWQTVGNATSYRIDVSEEQNFGSFTSIYSSLDVGNVLSHVVDLEIAPNTTYYYRVRAFNGFSESANSNTITVLTALAPPAAPVLNAPANISSEGFTASWGAVTDADGYVFDLAYDDGFLEYVAGYQGVDAGSATQHEFTGLDAETAYHLRVRAYNTSGSGPNSDTQVIETLMEAPGAPVALPPDVVNNDGFIAKWQAVDQAESYSITVALDNAFTQPVTGYQDYDAGNTTSLEITGLSPNTNYYYQVKATNEGGTGPASNTVSILTLPTAPTALEASAMSVSSFTANWQHPAQTGTAEYSYTIDVAESNDFTTGLFSESNIASSNTQTTIEGLSPGTQYWYRIYAVNATGPGAVSNTISVSTLQPDLAAAPAALNNFGEVFIGSQSDPQVITVSGQNLAGPVTVDAPVSFQVSGDGSSYARSLELPAPGGTLAATEVFVRFAPENEGSVSGSIIVSSSGAANDEVQVAGTGLASSVPAVTTLPPHSPTTTQFSSGGDVTNENGSNVTSKGIVWSTVASPTIENSKSEDGTGAGEFTSTASGLTANTLYYTRAYAVNADGPGYGQEHQQATLPLAPVINSFAAVDPVTAELNWAPAAGQGDADFTWDVQLSQTADFASPEVTLQNLASSTTTYQFDGLATGTTYHTRVRAVNAAGAGEWTASEPITTAAPDISVTPATLGDFGEVYFGRSSAPQPLEISGTNLLGNITAAFSAGFEGSLDGENWQTTIALPPVNGTVAPATLEVRFTPEAEGTITGDLIFSSESAESVAVALLGTGTPVEQPTVELSPPVEVTQNSIRLKGTIVSDGGNDIAERGFILAEGRDPTIDDNKLVEGGTDLGEFFGEYVDLHPGTEYRASVFVGGTFVLVTSDIITVTTIPGPPAVEVTGQTATSVELTITPPQGATMLKGHLSTTEDTDDVIGGFEVPAEPGTPVIQTITGLNGGNTYHYWVAAGNESGWSEHTHDDVATQLTAPVLLTPQDGSALNGSEVLFEWEPVNGAQSYALAIGLDENFELSETFENIPFANGTEELPDGTEYWWKVKAANASGFGPESATWSFAINLIPPSNLTALLNTDNSVDLSWSNGSQTVVSFRIYRSENGGEFTELAATAELETSYTDQNTSPSTTYQYKVVAFNDKFISAESNTAEVEVPTSVAGETSGVPETYTLLPNFPNPFNPSTTISYGLPFESNVSLTIYNVNGEAVAELLSRVQSPGYHSTVWNSGNNASGIYFYAIRAVSNTSNETYTQVRKMLLIK